MPCSYYAYVAKVLWLCVFYFVLFPVDKYDICIAVIEIPDRCVNITFNIHLFSVSSDYCYCFGMKYPILRSQYWLLKPKFANLILTMNWCYDYYRKIVFSRFPTFTNMYRCIAVHRRETCTIGTLEAFEMCCYEEITGT